MARRSIEGRVTLMVGMAAVAFSLAFAVGSLAGYVFSGYHGDQSSDGTLVASADAPDHNHTLGAPGGPATDESAFDRKHLKSTEAVFVQRASPQNILWNSTYLDHPSTNSHPNAFVLVKRLSEPGGDAENSAHEIGVWYDASRGGRWAIFNQHRAPMAAGATFKVVVVEGPNTMVHRARRQNTVANSTYIDDPLTNGNPDAVLTVTQNWNPGGVGNTYNDHPVGTRYDADEKKWVIFNRDQVPMPQGASFNIVVVGGVAETE